MKLFNISFHLLFFYDEKFKFALSATLRVFNTLLLTVITYRLCKFTVFSTGFFSRNGVSGFSPFESEWFLTEELLLSPRLLRRPLY